MRIQFTTVNTCIISIAIVNPIKLVFPLPKLLSLIEEAKNQINDRKIQLKKAIKHISEQLVKNLSK